MPTKDMTAISAKVRIKEKELFEELCKAKGLTPSQAIRSFIINCNERGTIAEPNNEQESALANYMKIHSITLM
jgi:antitoxin component of RelBE/YafQ-DinJ toxin-antitoxin module